MILGLQHTVAIAKDLAKRYTANYEKERTKELAAIQYAVEHHESMGNAYWENRWRAEQKMIAANNLLRALEEMQSEILSGRHTGLPH